MSKIPGRASIRVNGRFYDSLPGATITPGGTLNTEQLGTWEVHRSEGLVAAMVSASFPAKQGVSVQFFQGLADVELTFKADTGQTWVIRDAFVKNVVSLQVGNSGGFIPVEFGGSPADEVVA